MEIGLLLHIYQPPTQDLGITSLICQKSYRRILQIVSAGKGAITLNMPASLTIQLQKLSEHKFFDDLRRLVKENKIELTSTAAFHPLLPRLPRWEIERQILINDQINREIIGDDIYCPRGFFPPELAFSNQLGRLLNDLGYKWVIVDEHAYPKGLEKMKNDEIYYLKRKKVSVNISSDQNITNFADNNTGNLILYFRNEALSIDVAFSHINNLNSLESAIKKYEKKNPSYLIIAMDGETFGFHQENQDKLLLDILSNSKYHFVQISDIEKNVRKKTFIRPSTCSWAVSNADMRKKIYWPRWSFPGNDIHRLQWRLTALALKKKPETEFEQWCLDQSLHSDQYWWASRKPYWHPKLVKRGSWMLLQAILKNSKNSKKTISDAQNVYNDIVTELGGDEEKVDYLEKNL